MKYKFELLFGMLWAASVAALIIFSELLTSTNQAIYGLVLPMIEFGLLGVFLATFLSNFIVLLQVPYYLIIFEFALHSSDSSYLLMMGVVTGIATALGEVVKYYTYRTATHVIPDMEQSNVVKRLQEFVLRNQSKIPFFVFIFAISPLPDDAMILPLSISKIRPQYFFLPMLAGKIALGLIIVFGFTFFRNLVIPGFSAVDISTIIVVTFILMLVYSGVQVHIQKKKKL